MKRSRSISVPVFLLVIGLIVSPCFATQVRHLNLEDLTRKAGRIVAGRCTDVDLVEDVALGRRVTRVTILVDRSLKGGVGRTLTFRMIGDRTGSRPGGSGARPGRAAPGMPAFNPGEDLVLFLYPESAAGLTSPVGLGQGKFVVAPRKKGRPIAINSFGSHGLFRGMSDAARSRLGELAPHEQGRPVIARDALLQMIERLLPEGAP